MGKTPGNEQCCGRRAPAAQSETAAFVLARSVRTVPNTLPSPPSPPPSRASCRPTRTGWRRCRWTPWRRTWAETEEGRRVETGLARACQLEHASWSMPAGGGWHVGRRATIGASASRQVPCARYSGGGSHCPPSGRSLLEVLGQVLAPQDGCRQGAGRGRTERSCQEWPLQQQRKQLPVSSRLRHVHSAAPPLQPTTKRTSPSS